MSFLLSSGAVGMVWKVLTLWYLLMSLMVEELVLGSLYSFFLPIFSMLSGLWLQKILVKTSSLLFSYNLYPFASLKAFWNSFSFCSSSSFKALIYATSSSLLGRSSTNSFTSFRLLS